MTFDPVAYINTPRWQQQRLGLERIVALMDKLGNPQTQVKFVHVAGTNGKGSVCSYVAQMLQTAGYTVGLFTSPYIVCFEERIRINGENIPADDLCSVTLAVRDAADELEQEMGEHPTEFELMTAVALLYFARQHCDIAVVEVGLGGRLDSTNVIVPEVSVITRIGLDHTDILGTTLAEIAGEKAGIIKPGVPVVAYPQDEQVMEVIAHACEERGCALHLPDFESVEVGPISPAGLRTFSYGGVPYETQLLATYQPYNAAVALAVASVLTERGYTVTPHDMQAGIRATKWQGRFEVVDSDPLFIVDGAHNPQGAHELRISLENLVANLREQGSHAAYDAVFITGVLADKDYQGMMSAVLGGSSAAADAGATEGAGEPVAPAEPLFEHATFLTYTPDNPRALDAQALAEAIAAAASYASATEDAASASTTASSAHRLSAQPIQVRACGTPEKATELAIEIASSGNGECKPIVIAFGTLYAIGQIKRALDATAERPAEA